MKIVSRYQMILARENAYVFYHKGKIYFSPGMNDLPKKIVALHSSAAARILSAFSLTERLFRLIPRCAAWVGDNQFILASKGKIYCIDLTEKTAVPEHDFPQAMSAPLYFCSLQGLDGFEDGTLYGMYTQERQNISIWHRSVSGEWKEIFQFAQGTILHIHNIIADYDNKRLLILTGDSDSESGIWEARNNFSMVQPILMGSQQYRSCYALSSEGKLIFATDTPLEQNWIYEYNENSQNIHKVCEMPGPVIFGTEYLNEGHKRLVLATSVESDSRMHGIQYLLSNKLAKGVKNRYTHLFIGDSREGFRELCSFKKDWLPMALFQFGNIYFPQNTTSKLYICPQNVKKYHGKTLEISVD